MSSAIHALDERTHKQRMLAGDLYQTSDPELVAEFLAAHRAARAFNLIDQGERATQQEALRVLFGAIGEGCEVREGLRIELGYNIFLGDNVFLNFNPTLLDIAPITIGDDTLIGPNVNLLTPTHPVEARTRLAKWEAAKPITLGRNVWLGGNVTVLPGVSIGSDTAVGAGAVVARDLPEGVVAVGNPARIVRMLTPAERTREAVPPEMIGL